MSYRFVAVTKDNKFVEMVKRSLAGQPGKWENTASVSEAWRIVFSGEADLLLLDMELPGAERLGWFRTLRQAEGGHAFPVVLVSTEKSDDELAEAFELGADDYILKSCEEREMLARLRSVLRRRYEKTLVQEGVVSVGAVSLDLSRHLCRVRGKPVELNPREFELLETLLRKAGRVLSRPYLLETVWGMSAAATTRTVDVSVSRLRKAMGPRAARLIETVERYGYRFRDPADAPR